MGCVVQTQQNIKKHAFPNIILLKLEFKCKICINPYDTQQYAPMIMNCGHTICKLCIQSFPKSLCPFDKIPFDKRTIKKNFEVVNLIQQANSLEKTHMKDNDQNVDIYCKNNHKIQWRNKVMTCSHCHHPLAGWQCQQCKYNRCIKCSSLKPNKLCFNNHSTQWNSLKELCVACNQNKSGWQCKICTYNICSKCEFIPKNKDFCPNGHKSLWLSNKIGYCNYCQQQKNGFSCKICNFTVCDNCLQIQYSSKKCPNNHNTQWIGSEKKNNFCFKCKKKADNGFGCRQCQYFICFQCSNWKYKDNLCPNNHQITWVKSINKCKINCKNLKKHGFKCMQCNYQICTKCKSIDIRSKTCFNQHKTEFTSSLIFCIQCNLQKNTGWQCGICQFSFCSGCTRTNLVGKQCPNNHLKIWKNNKSFCMICKKFDHGWYCDICKLMTCSRCEGTNLSESKCPNNHPLSWNQLQQTNCINCKDMRSNVWTCKKCEYYSCMKCTKGILKKSACPNQHALFEFQAENLIKCQVCQQYIDKYYNCINQCLIICLNCYNNAKR